jgi:hypothetical protein
LTKVARLIAQRLGDRRARRRRKKTYLAPGGDTFGHPAASNVYARRAASAFEGGKRFEPGAALMASYLLGAGEWVADYEVEML